MIAMKPEFNLQDRNDGKRELTPAVVFWPTDRQDKQTDTQMHIQIISLGKQKFSLNFAKSQKGLEVTAEILGPAKKYWPGSHWS